MPAGVALLAILPLACSPADDDHLAHRRASLLASLVNPDNAYSRLRIDNYAIAGTAWEVLPVWNPAVERVTPAQLDVPGGGAREPMNPSPLRWEAGAERDDEAALLTLGEAAFFGYPLQRSPDLKWAVRSRQSSLDYGFWLDDARGAGGIVRVRLADGTSGLALTCSSCHAVRGHNGLVVGQGNERLEPGRLAVEAAAAAGGGGGGTLNAATWGPGRIDVSTEAGTEPVRMADLRPVALLSHLHADATVAQIDRESLAIRIETLMITSSEGVVRPPRVVARALAAYVWSLASSLPNPDPVTLPAMHGRAILEARCGACHTPPSFSGAPVAVEAVGTNPIVGMSKDRGTGMYRVPSLRGVGTRTLLLHDASLSSLESLLDPARLQPDYANGVRPGPVPGHEYGLDLAPADRQDLIAYLRGL